MRKIFLLFSCMMIFLIFDSDNKVSAITSDGYLRMEDFVIGENKGVENPEFALDGNSTTFARFSNGNEYVEYILVKPQILKTFDFTTSRDNGILFFDESDKEILAINADSKRLSYDISSISQKKVAKIRVRALQANFTMVYSMEIGVDKPISHDKDIKNFSAVQSLDTISLLWDSLEDKTNISKIILYRNGNKYKTFGTDITAFLDESVVAGQTYTYKLALQYVDDYVSNGSIQTVTVDSSNLPKDETAPDDITDLQTEPFKDSIKLTFKNPINEDFRLVNIYSDGKLVGTSTNGTFTIIGLKPEIDYVITLKSVDSSGNESNGITKNVQTLSEKDVLPPDSPTGLKAENFSNGSTISWNKNKESDIQGYNVYIDGVKVNTSLIPNTSYTLKGLDKNKSYSVSVTAVDTSNNESVHSLLITARPNPDALPIIETGFELKDIAEGTANTFNSLWMVVAFASAIPLSFYVAGRVKLLFL